MITFVTPYWCGSEMMRIHLESIRKFYPAAPILISKRGGGKEEMERYERDFGIWYWLEDCDYFDALFRLFRRVETDYVCISDHDVVLFSSPEHLIRGLAKGSWDLVGVEDRIRDPYATAWMRYAPGYMDSNFMIFNLRRFLRRWGFRGVRFEADSLTCSIEYHYGICEKLGKHKYLSPYHTAKYGFGNLLRDGETDVAWHQWFGSHRLRPILDMLEPDSSIPEDQRLETLAKAEQTFLDDYPNLDLSSIRPAWGPGLPDEPFCIQPWPFWRRLVSRATRFRVRYSGGVRRHHSSLRMEGWGA